jgi:hypothetical protein
MYETLLRSLAADRSRHWHALPREVSRWWRLRSRQQRPEGLPGATVRSISILDPPWLPERSASPLDPVAAATS